MAHRRQESGPGLAELDGDARVGGLGLEPEPVVRRGQRGDEGLEDGAVARRQRPGWPEALDDDAADLDPDRGLVRIGVRGACGGHRPAEPHRAHGQAEQLHDRGRRRRRDGRRVVAAPEAVREVEADLGLPRPVLRGLAQSVQAGHDPADQCCGHEERAEGDEVVVAFDREVPTRLGEAVHERDEAAAGRGRAGPWTEQGCEEDRDEQQQRGLGEVHAHGQPDAGRDPDQRERAHEAVDRGRLHDFLTPAGSVLTPSSRRVSDDAVMSLTIPEASVDATARPETSHSLPLGSPEQASANAGVDRPRPRPAGVSASAGPPAGLRAVVFVSRVDDGLDRALRYLAHLGSNSVRAVHLGGANAGLGAEFWARYGRALEFVPRRRSVVHRARAVVRAECAADPDGVLAVVVPGCADRGRRHLVRRAGQRRVQAGILRESGVIIVNAP